jgi:hypothetical protein
VKLVGVTEVVCRFGFVDGFLVLWNNLKAGSAVL